jgi:4-hydroxy 2-oxovalerate aldolase
MTKKLEKNMQQVILSDATLRDGNHAVSHQISAKDIENYCTWVDKTSASWVEVGHGNGLGASSYHIGKSAISDELALKTARSKLSIGKLSVHVMPGMASIFRDVDRAAELGVDVFRIASHCTEANITLRFIEHVRNLDKTAVGVLMMSHMVTHIEFLEQALLMQEAGAQAIVLMDSAGSLQPKAIQDRFEILEAELQIPTGIHAHNNLGFATINSLAAVDAGARIVDACIGGFGAGAGNAQIELLSPLLSDMGLHNRDEDLYAEVATKALGSFATSPVTNGLTIATGRAGLFSGYLNPIVRAAEEFQVSPYLIIEELGRRKVVAGQEDMIREIAFKINQT